MPRDRDVGAFQARAPHYEQGWLGRLHRDIADRTAALALSTNPYPHRVLDVGCGTGYLLRGLASRCRNASELAGMDPAPSMIEMAAASADDQRLGFLIGVAEHLPYRANTFDLVVSSTSFDHWSDQQAGLSECARVLVPGGALLLVDQFSRWLALTLLLRRGKARTRKRVDPMLQCAGFRSIVWHDLYAVIIKAAVAMA